MTTLPARSVGPRALLQRILDTPEQVSALQRLEAPVLARLIHHVGLEDSGELVALATTEQLSRIFDEDLWRGGRPGQEERFDAERFGLWLEVMLEMGADRAARKLVEMDEDFLTLALSSHVLVLDLDALTLGHLRAGDGRKEGQTLVDKALESSLSHELDKYLLVARRAEGWDAVLAVLVALDEEHHDFLTGLLERCCYLASEYIEDHGGLYDVLTASEQLEADVAQGREERRERQGFVAPTSAASFLGLARKGAVGTDVITRAYFRSLEDAARTSGAGPVAAPPAPDGSGASLTRLLQEAEVLPSRAPVALPGAGEGTREDEAPTLRQALAWLREEDAARFSRCMGELGYLSNVLHAGCGHGGRALRPLEAAQAAIAACNLGLERRLAGEEGARPGPLLSREGLVALFGEGWRALTEEVVTWTAEALVRVLARAAPAGRGEAAQVRAALERDLAAGRPWASRQRLPRVGALLSREALRLVRELIDECPTFEGAFIGTRARLERARQRVRELLPG